MNKNFNPFGFFFGSKKKKEIAGKKKNPFSKGCGQDIWGHLFRVLQGGMLNGNNDYSSAYNTKIYRLLVAPPELAELLSQSLD